MLNSADFLNIVKEQNDQDRTVPQTLRALGLDVTPDERNGEEFTRDEMILTELAAASASMVHAMADSVGKEADPVSLSLQGLMIGLAIGYISGIREGLDTGSDDEPLTFPKDWNPDAA